MMQAPAGSGSPAYTHDGSECFLCDRRCRFKPGGFDTSVCSTKWPQCFDPSVVARSWQWACLVNAQELVPLFCTAITIQVNGPCNPRGAQHLQLLGWSTPSFLTEAILLFRTCTCSPGFVNRAPRGGNACCLGAFHTEYAYGHCD